MHVIFVLKVAFTLAMFINVLLAASLLYISNSAIHYVIPKNYQVASTNNYNYANTLQHFLNNSKKFFVSHVQLYFMPGEHYLNIDMVLKDISNFTITGINYTVTCTSPASITAVNISDLKL